MRLEPLWLLLLLVASAAYGLRRVRSLLRLMFGAATSACLESAASAADAELLLCLQWFLLLAMVADAATIDSYDCFDAAVAGVFCRGWR